MALVFEPTHPFAQLGGLILAVTALAILARGFVDGWRCFGRHRRTRAFSLILDLLACALLGLALWNPFFASRDEPGRAHLVLLMDTSESALRVSGGWDQHRAGVVRLLERLSDSMSADERAAISFDLFTFGVGPVRVAGEIPLGEAAERLANLERGSFAAGRETDLAAALEAAGSRIDRLGGGNGAVLLVSDGHETRGDAVATAEQLARRGIPVHARPLESGGPEVAITSADLPPRVVSGTQTHLRGVLRNSSEQAVPTRLMVARNPGLASDAEDVAAPLESRRDLALDSWSRLRQDMVFEGYGLQFAEVVLSDRRDRVLHRRRFFTQVTRPPRILAVGGDNRWLAAFPESAAEITEIRPEALVGEEALRDRDAIVISAVTADRFSRAALQQIAEAVTGDGMGLMLVNGDHAGSDPRAETVLMSYRETPLEPLLPVHPGPRPEDEQPSRNVVLMIDTSGSMSGLRLSKAKEIASYLVAELLASRDRLDIITFTTGAAHPIKDMKMIDQNRAEALRVIEGLRPGGGTNPNQALALLQDRVLDECGLVFISDGEFGAITARPECRTTAFAIGRDSLRPNAPIWDLADPFLVPSDFNPRSIRIPFFQPEPRDTFYEPGPFRALPVARFTRGNDRLTVPPIPLPGNAVTYLADEAELVVVRPKLTDPVLAYRRAGLGYSGVMTSSFSPTWLSDRRGREAVVGWINRLIPFTARDRYDFEIEDRGETLFIEISVTSEEGPIPRLEALSLSLEIEDDAPIGVAMRPVDGAPGSFRGQVRLTRGETTRKGVLEIRETGLDALGRPQRVPILIPRKGLVNADLGGEAFSYGTNEALLRTVADVGGGRYDPPEGARLFRRNPILERGPALWPYLVLAAAVCYVGAFGLRRSDP